MPDVTMSPPNATPAAPAGTVCCGDPKNLNANKHPWILVTEDGPGDIYVCPECGATDVD